MFTDKKGQTATTAWALVFFFLILIPIAVLFIIMNNVFDNYLLTEVENIVAVNPLLNETQKTDLIEDSKKFDAIWYWLPWVIIITLIVWLIINSMRKRVYE